MAVHRPSVTIGLLAAAALLAIPTHAAQRRRQPTIYAGVLNSKAKTLPPPEYPEFARLAGLTGTVRVRVFIDYNGHVTEAKALSGRHVFRQAAIDAAKKATFPPSKITCGKCPLVAGILLYRVNGLRVKSKSING